MDMVEVMFGTRGLCILNWALAETLAVPEAELTYNKVLHEAELVAGCAGICIEIMAMEVVYA